jgi:plasmid maintenance system antidote protein VapI
MTHQKQTPKFNQDEKTKQFIEQAKTLIIEGKAKNYAEIASKIDWPKSSLSDAINGRKNVPYEVLKRFSDYYGLSTKDWRDEKIELLQQMNDMLKEQLEEKKALFRELDQVKQLINDFEGRMAANLVEYQEDATARLAMLHAIQRNLTEHRAKQEKASLEQLQNFARKVLAEETKRLLGQAKDNF